MQAFPTNKHVPGEQKLRGGYYTPHTLSSYLCKWAIRTPADSVLEPSCGDGSFVSTAATMLGEHGRITAVEISPPEIDKAKVSVNGTAASVEWHCASFFDVAPRLLKEAKYDAVVGNPPFIRFQYFDRAERERAFRLMGSFGYRPNGLANAWIAFVQLSTELLRDGGRLAMVLPAELLQVKYAAELRYRLPLLFEDVHIVAFDELVFPEIQQEVVLLLAAGRRRTQEAGRLHTLAASNGEELLTAASTSPVVSHAPVRHAHPEMKWTSLFLEDEEFRVLDECSGGAGLNRLGQLADVDVGIVTGRNGFFVINGTQARELGATDYVLDIVGRTSALGSIRFADDDLASYAESNPSKLLNLAGVKRHLLPTGVQAYIRSGEEQGVHRGYKCRIRSRWFDVPSTHVPDAFLYRQIHRAPLLVANHAGATTTDTIHRVRVNGGVCTDTLCAASVNSLTFAWAEVSGRSYGGGVLELEPGEAEGLLIPYRFARDLDLDYIDAQLRAGNLQAAADHGDDVMLRRGCGLSRTDLQRIRAAWNRLRSRRQGRKHRSRRTREKNGGGQS